MLEWYALERHLQDIDFHICDLHLFQKKCHCLAKAEFISQPLSPLQFPEHPYGDLSSKVILLKHNAGDGLSPLSDMDEIPDGCLLEIVLKG